MIKPDLGWEPTRLAGFFLCQNATVAGTIMQTDNTDATTTGVGDCNYGNVVPANVTTADPSYIGALFYDVVNGCPSFQNVVGGVLQEVTGTGYACTLFKLERNDVISTDQFLATGTGAITAGQSSGNTATGTLLGVKNGQFVLASAFSGGAAGSVAIAKLIGNTTIGSAQLIRVQIL
jgi:hypothetical protein